MNKQQREILIAKAVLAVAKSAGKDVDEWGMEIWTDTLGELEDVAFDRAIVFLRKQYQAQRMPSVKEVEDAALQRASGKNDVDEAVARICSAIRTCGYSSLERAREFVGELGWAIVARYGGWQAVCSVESEKDLAVMRAQMKQTGESVRERSSMGILNKAPALPSSEESPRGLTPSSSIIAGLLNGIR